MLHGLVLSIKLGTVQTGTRKVDPARNVKCTTASREEGSEEKDESGEKERSAEKYILGVCVEWIRKKEKENTFQELESAVV